jgi:serine beta-lactamase-like protein LACTB
MTQKAHRTNVMRCRPLAAMLILTIYLSAVSHAPAQTRKLSDESQARIESAITMFMTTNKVPGMSVAVVQDGEFVWSGGFGMADLENAVPATSQTLYRLGSISKPLTATAAMKLWETGRLDLDTPVQKYCPSFPQKPWPLTTRQLLGHLGGIRYYNVPEMPYSVSQTDPEVGNTRHFENGVEGGLKFFATEPLVAQPGTHFNYTTQGYTVVGCAIEGASGKSYADYVRESVLVPAGMLQTRPDDRFAIIPSRTRFYSKDKSGAVVNAEFLDSSYKVPGGGWLASAPDMARFAAATLNDQLVKRTTRDLMWTEQLPTDGLGRMAYGLGWQLGVMDGVKDLGHGGTQQGASAMLLIAPAERAGVVVLTNSDAAGPSALAPQLLRAVLGSSAKSHTEIPVDPSLYEAYVGSYQMNDFRLSFTREGDRLLVELNGQKIQVFPESVRDYFFKDLVEIQITFVMGGDGRAAELILHEAGVDAHMNRVK